MIKTLKPITLPFRALNKLKPLKICLIAISVSACGKAPPFPTNRIFETNTTYKVCGEYKVVDLENMKYEHVTDHPLEKCNGNFGFQTSDVPKVTRWVPKMQKYVKDHCE
jgi:hypothetical protein